MLIDPPRSENVIAPVDLPEFEKRGGWLLQYKRNGQYSIVHVDANKNLKIENRHGEAHKNWQLGNANGTKDFFQSLPHGVYVAELINAKVKGLRDIHYFHDILSQNGTPLIGQTYQRRYNLLCDAIGAAVKGQMNTDTLVTPGHYVVRPNIWLARNHTKDFAEIFASLKGEEDEGVVLKMIDGGQLNYRNNAGGWTVKCRRPHKNFGF